MPIMAHFQQMYNSQLPMYNEMYKEKGGLLYIFHAGMNVNDSSKFKN